MQKPPKSTQFHATHNHIFNKEYIYLSYEENLKQFVENSNDLSINDALTQLEYHGGRLKSCVIESITGHKIANAWNDKFIAGPLGSPLAHAIATRPNIIGLGEDRFGKLMVAASMCGIPALKSHISTNVHGCIAFLAHDIRDLRHSLLKSQHNEEKAINTFGLSGIKESNDAITSVLPRVGVARGRFWELVHIEVRNLFVLATRKLKAAGVSLDPVDDVINAFTLEASKRVHQSDAATSMIDRLNSLQGEYAAICSNKFSGLTLLPTTPIPAIKSKDWPVQFNLTGPDYLEYVMPAILADLVSISIPCGFTVDRLPVGLQILARPEMTGQALYLAEWYLRQMKWPTLASRPANSEQYSKE